MLVGYVKAFPRSVWLLGFYILFCRRLPSKAKQILVVFSVRYLQVILLYHHHTLCNVLTIMGISAVFIEPKPNNS